MPSSPEAFQLGIFLHCFVTFSTLLSTLSWRCLSFPSSLFISFDHSASQLCPFPTVQRSPQNLYFLKHLVHQLVLPHLHWIGASIGLTPTPVFWSKWKILFFLIFSIFNVFQYFPIFNDLNNDLAKINDWTYEWKMNFNSDPSKQAQEVLFSSKIKSPNHPCLHFSNNPVNQTPFQKHLGMYLDLKLDFLEH